MSRASLITMSISEAIRLLGTIAFFFGSVQGVSQSTASRSQEVASEAGQAKEFLKEQRPDLAIPEFRAMVALDPNNVDARGNLGVLLFFQGAYADAIPQLKAALKLRPTLWKIQAVLGMAERRTGDSKSALSDLEKAFPRLQEQKIQIEAGMELIEIHTAAGDRDKAAAMVSALRTRYPTDIEVLYASYRIYSDLSAESILSLSVVDPNSARMHQAIAHELAKRGDIAEAFQNYRAALKIDPQLPGLHFELAEALSTLSTTEGRAEAEKEYTAALEVNPSDEQAECRLGQIALQRDDVNGANEHYTRAIQLRPADAEANIGMAKVLMTMDQPRKAEACLLRALQEDPTSALAHFRLSTVYRQTGRMSDAKRELAEYQKYKDLKERLRTIYHDLHQEQGVGEKDESHPK
jgi:Tfp pilus assembly protein PilF